MHDVYDFESAYYLRPVTNGARQKFDINQVGLGAFYSQVLKKHLHAPRTALSCQKYHQKYIGPYLLVVITYMAAQLPYFPLPTKLRHDNQSFHNTSDEIQDIPLFLRLAIFQGFFKPLCASLTREYS